MADQARVLNVDALDQARDALSRVAVALGAVVSGVETDTERMGAWLTTERPAHWKTQIRKRVEAVNVARAAISRKIMMRAPDPADTVEEERALRRAQKRHEEAERRAAATRRWMAEWEKHHMTLYSMMQGLNESVSVDLPAAIERLRVMSYRLEEYLAARPREGGLGGVGDEPPAGLGSPESGDEPQRNPADSIRDRTEGNNPHTEGAEGREGT